jgi:hypothetical protein
MDERWQLERVMRRLCFGTQIPIDKSPRSGILTELTTPFPFQALEAFWQFQAKGHLRYGCGTLDRQSRS